MRTVSLRAGLAPCSEKSATARSCAVAWRVTGAGQSDSQPEPYERDSGSELDLLFEAALAKRSSEQHPEPDSDLLDPQLARPGLLRLREENATVDCLVVS